MYDFDNDFNLERLIVYNDSIWIKLFRADPLSENLIQFCHIRDTSKNKGYFTYGKAGMEMLSTVACFNDNFLVVNDSNQGNKLAVFNMDSVFNDNYTPEILLNRPLVNYNNFVLKNGDILMEKWIGTVMSNIFII